MPDPVNLLQVLGDKYGTDKGQSSHTYFGRSYLDIYHSYFAAERESFKTVFEIGVLRGESLRMWEEYFPKAEIWGLDINPAAASVKSAIIRVVTGSQTDPDAIACVAPKNNFDLVVDDGSHVVNHIVRTFELIWPRVNPGGFYCIEDLGLSYADIKESLVHWPGQTCNSPDTDYDNAAHRPALDALLLGKIKNMDCLHGDTAFIHFYPNLCIIRKAP